MTFRTSVLWKLNMHMAKKWTEMVKKQLLIILHLFRLVTVQFFFRLSVSIYSLSVLQKMLFWLLLLACTHQGTFQNICSSTISLDFNAVATLLPWADFFDRNCRWLGLIKWEMEQKEDRGDKNAFPIQGTFRKIVHPLKLLNSHSFSQAFW